MIRCRVPVALMRQLTEAQERNIYIHPNPLAREIFWQRIDRLSQHIDELVPPVAKGLDFGGGSGSLVCYWQKRGGPVDLVDLDTGDARRLQTHFHADNLRIIETDIAQHIVDEPYDFIVAADVLEHFPALDFPVQQILRLLKPGGLLFISVPSENFIYELGRKIIRKSKPADHYHDAKTIFSYLAAAGLHLVHKDSVPRILMVNIPLFTIGVFKK